MGVLCGREENIFLSKGAEQPLVQQVTDGEGEAGLDFSKPTTKMKREAKIMRAYSELLVYPPLFPFAPSPD